MSDKVLIIISTAEAEKAQTGMMYALNALKKGWMKDVKLILFGPSENLILKDKEMQDFLKQYLELTEKVVACKFIADRDNTTAQIEASGIKVEYVGEMISDLIKEGYIPMVW